MILTAIVQTKDGTLVVDLPRDRIDLEMKIRSVGIERLSDQIHIIDDEEKSDISVKLFGESDIGRHLSLLFNENHTLFDVNKTMQFVANSVEDIRDDLEMNIIHDQYDTPAELVGDIERMTDEVGQYTETFYDEVGQYTETFYFPLVGNMEDDDDGEQYEVGNRYLRYYEYEIRELLQKEQDLDGTNMKDYFYDDDNAQKKMVSCQWDIVDRSNTLYGKVDFRLKEPFTAEEKELVRSWCIGQAADGLGEGLEQRPIETEDGDLYVSMWNSCDDYFMYDEDEMNDYLAQQQGGVMTQ